MAWIASTLLFFSLTAGKRLRHLLPIEPAFALLFALTLRSWLAGRKSVAGRRLAIAAGVVWLGQLVAYAGVLPALDPTYSPRAVAEAVVALAQPGERVALYHAADIANGVTYYGGVAVEAFRGEEQLAAFLARGGGVLVMEDAREPAVARRADVAVASRHVIDGDRWVVARVRPKAER